MSTTLTDTMRLPEPLDAANNHFSCYHRPTAWKKADIEKSQAHIMINPKRSTLIDIDFAFIYNYLYNSATDMICQLLFSVGRDTHGAFDLFGSYF